MQILFDELANRGGEFFDEEFLIRDARFFEFP